jgi:hypothetical protein
MSWLIRPGWRPSGHRRPPGHPASRGVPVEARNAWVGDLAVHRRSAYPHREPAAPAAIPDCVGGEFVCDEHDVGGTAFRHARGHRAGKYRLAQYVKGIRVKFVLKHPCRLRVIAAPGGPLQSGTATLTAVLLACGTLGCDGWLLPAALRLGYPSLPARTPRGGRKKIRAKRSPTASGSGRAPVS